MVAKGLFLCLAIYALLRGGHCNRSAALDELVTSALCSFRNNIPKGWSGIGVPPLDLVEVPFQGIYGENREITTSGMSDFTIENIDSNVLLMRTAITLNIPLLEITESHQHLVKSSSVIPNLLVGIGVRFMLSEEERLFAVEEVDVKFEFALDDFDYSGHEWLTADDISEILRESYQVYLENAIAFEIDAAMQTYGEDDEENNDLVTDFFDRFFADVRGIVLDYNLDPMQLPEDSDDFTISLLNTTLDGSLRIYKGSLGGLATLHRAGNMTVKYILLKSEVIWKGNIGLNDIEIDYSFDLKLPLFGKELDFSIQFSYVHLSFETEILLLKGNVTLTQCSISELGPIHYKEKGAGPLDTPLYNILTNSILGELHVYVLELGSAAICSLLEDTLSLT